MTVFIGGDISEAASNNSCSTAVHHDGSGNRRAGAFGFVASVGQDFYDPSYFRTSSFGQLT